MIIDQLPANVIQHVKSGNNPALTAALEATIRQEQSQSTVGSLSVPPPTVMHHAAPASQQVQQSRPVSSDESDSSTEDTSSSSEETDSEQSQVTHKEHFPLNEISSFLLFSQARHFHLLVQCLQPSLLIIVEKKELNKLKFLSLLVFFSLSVSS